MTDNDRKEFGTHLLEMQESLGMAIQKAGGDPFIVGSSHRLKEMSAFDLMCHLAPNGVRFIHVNTSVESKKT